MREFEKYLISLILSTCFVFFMIAPNLGGVENMYESLILTLIAMHFIVSHALGLLERSNSNET